MAFVDATRNDLRFALEYLHEPALQERAYAAWTQIEERGEFEQVRRAIAGREYDEALDAVGLSGEGLAFKLAVVDQARARVSAALEARAGDDEQGEEQGREDPAEPVRRPRWIRRLRARLAKLLGSVDVILDSLVGALSGAGEIIKEFKQGLEKALEE